MDPAVLEILKKAGSSVRMPAGGDKIYKDECLFSFDSPDYPTGLYVCLRTFLGFGEPFVQKHYAKTGSDVYLHIRRIKTLIKKDKDGDPPEKKVTKMAIGVSGGFDVGRDWKVETEERYEVVVMPGLRRVSYPNEEIPEMINMCVGKVIAAESATRLQELESLAGTWDGEVRQVSKNAENLVQLPNPKRVPPSGWKCENCDKTDNLWLNLTDGAILCGRKFFDGSGGNNHAVEHFHTTGHPLCVKLGTITADGKGDVFDYQLDDMVEDPHLAKHLAHFGINVQSMEKTEKTMTELEIEINQKMEWSVLTESGSDLKPVYGPGYTGITNLGNSCYLSSVMQVVYTIPDFQKRYVEPSAQIFDNAGGDPVNDFNVQMAKLGCGLMSGRYSKPKTELYERQSVSPGDAGDEKEIDDMKWQMGIPPRAFKTLIGRGHPEFSTRHQQDASEFVLHLINLVERHSSRGPANPGDCFKFKVEDRVQCQASGRVSYKYRSEYLLPLPVPMSAAWNKDEVAAYERKKAEADAKKITLSPTEVVRPALRLDDCLSSFAATERVERFFSTAIKDYTTAEKSTRFATFPRYLFIQLKKFSLAADWTPMKLDVSVAMPDELNLEALRANGLQPGEEKLPDAKEKPKVELNQNDIEQLVNMGFPLEACKKAVYNTNNSGIEAATNWIMEHIGDDDFSQPFVIPGTDHGADDFVPNEEALGLLVSMGFTLDQARLALKNTGNNVERAGDWIFSHQHELDALVAAEKGQAAGKAAVSEPVYDDGPPNYKLVAFISHMGSSAFVGHYVCHILKEGRWVIFNDEKVALSEHPPKDLGYLYLYERV